MTTDKLVELVRKSGLVESDRLDAFLAKATAEHGALPADKRLAELMVTAGMLTPWQTEKLLAGKHRGFRIGKYKLLGQIGKGGMSSVYLAEHILMRRRVAIKVLPQNRVKDASYLERFQLEARAVARLDDPNIVRAFDIDNEANVHYIVMEYVDGSDLHQHVSKHGTLDYDTAADFIAQAANGLAHAHEMGLVHRDIKPANLLLDKRGTVKLLDLGLAKLTEDEEPSLTLAHDENVLGTADYLAPEQALNSHKADARADIYSLGCTLYFLLTGRPPFPEGSISERLLKHQVEEPQSILKFRPDAPLSLVEICARMMAKKPDERIQSAADVAELLTQWLSERGRAPGGGRTDHHRDAEDEGVGSGALTRFGPPAGSGLRPPGSSQSLSSPNRDTQRLFGPDTATRDDEEVGLAPLDEEDRPAAKSKASSSGVLSDSPSAPKPSPPAARSGPHKTIFEEEFAQSPQPVATPRQSGLDFDPLHPPGYKSPYDKTNWVPYVVALAAFALIGILLAVFAS
ncbi:serine/threonine-protein kinase [Pirellulimonas nuda]|uniref:serine/threonine-protein kinase n=1 Tax=Pirellulimonas nuda TaxID=2528009 RepID=UPI001E51B25C|nr:serine/threonine-protein kinase [Pirellulimonas nuda]